MAENLVDDRIVLIHVGGKKKSGADELPFVRDAQNIIVDASHVEAFRVVVVLIGRLDNYARRVKSLQLVWEQTRDIVSRNRHDCVSLTPLRKHRLDGQLPKKSVFSTMTFTSKSSSGAVIEAPIIPIGSPIPASASR